MMTGIPFPVNMLLLTQNEVIPTREMHSAYPRTPQYQQFRHSKDGRRLISRLYLTSRCLKYSFSHGVLPFLLFCMKNIQSISMVLRNTEPVLLCAWFLVSALRGTGVCTTQLLLQMPRWPDLVSLISPDIAIRRVEIRCLLPTAGFFSLGSGT